MSRRVILFNNSLSGGAGKSIIMLSEALIEEGIAVDVVIYENKIDYELDSNFPLTLLDESSHKFNKKLIANMLIDRLHIEESDIIISNSSPSNKILSMLRRDNIWHCVRSAETKNFRGFIGALKSRYRDSKYRRLYNGKKLITVSRGLKDYILYELKAKPKRVETIYNAFDFDEIERLSKDDIEDIPKRDYIIHIGRYDIAHKRHDILLEAYKLSDIKYPLILLGKGRDERTIKEIIKDLKLEDRVIMPGFQQNPYPWIKRAKLFVLSSDFEGFARVLPEALFLNTPVVSTNCPTGPAEILTGELSSYLTPPGDSSLLAQKMNEALNYYPPIDRAILKKFTKKEIAKEYRRVLFKN